MCHVSNEICYVSVRKKISKKQKIFGEYPEKKIDL